MPIRQFKEIEDFVSQYTPRPQEKRVNFNENRYYNFLVFDTETNSTSKSAEVCQLLVTDKSGLHTFSEYILPMQDIEFHASRVNKLKILNVNGERKLFKNDELLHTLPFHEAIAHFLSYVSKSIDRAKTITNKDLRSFRYKVVSLQVISLQSRFATKSFRYNLKSFRYTHKVVSLQILSRFTTLIRVIYCLCFVLYIILINILSVLKRPGSELGTLGNWYDQMDH